MLMVAVRSAEPWGTREQSFQIARAAAAVAVAVAASVEAIEALV